MAGIKITASMSLQLVTSSCSEGLLSDREWARGRKHTSSTGNKSTSLVHFGKCHAHGNAEGTGAIRSLKAMIAYGQSDLTLSGYAFFLFSF